ncbi:SDR family oxidoreductase [Streptomyces sp. M19]
MLVSRRGADDEERAAAVRRLTDAGGEVLAVAADLTEDGAAAEAVGRAVRHFGGLDVIVHAAAVPFGAVLEVRDGEAARANHAVKVDAALALARAARATEGAGPGTLLVHMSSVPVDGGAVGAYDYLASNLFLDALASSGPDRRAGRASRAWPGAAGAAPAWPARWRTVTTNSPANACAPAWTRGRRPRRSTGACRSSWPGNGG